MANLRAKSRFYRSADGLRLHLRDYDPSYASGLPVVCLPGLTRSAEDFDALASALAFTAAPARRVLAFDYRGRGLSAHDEDWRHYALGIEAGDVIQGLAFSEVTRAHFVGTSRGGLMTMALAADHSAMIASAVLNDIGPVLEPAGLSRIKSYVGQRPAPHDMDDAIKRLRTTAGRDFTGLSDEDWRVFAATTFGIDPERPVPAYDPALARTLDSFDLSQPIPDLWLHFDRLRDRPVLTIRGGNSDLLASGTFEAMTTRWPGCSGFEVPGQGHAPLLIDSASIAAIAAFLTSAEP